MKKKIFFIVVFCMEAIFVMAQNISKVHVVQRGESIESISEYYKISIEELKKANPNIDDLIYVGMKLVIPINANVAFGGVQSKDSMISTVKSVNNSYTENTSTGWQRNRPHIVCGLNYFATSFKDVRASGHYGIFLSASNIGYSLFGFDATLGSFNWGLVDKDLTNDVILFGPNVSYEIIPNLQFLCSAQCCCLIYFDGTDTEKSWGWAVVPGLRYNINRFSIKAGLFVDGSFKNGGGVDCGFELGLGICM